MSFSAILVPLAISVAVSALTPPQARKKLANAPKNNNSVKLETRFNNQDMLLKTLEEHGIPVEVTADGRIFTPLGDGRIVYSRPSADSPFVMEISEIGDIQCLIDELIALEEEYNGNVQSYTYDRVVNQLPEGMSIESEEVTDDNTIVLTLTVD